MNEVKNKKPPILAGLTPQQRAKRLAELFASDPPLRDIDYFQLQSELTPQEQVIAVIGMGMLGLGKWMQHRESRKAITPEERASKHLAAWLNSVAAWFAQCESMTIDEFAWLCVQHDPREPNPSGGLFVNETDRRREQVREQLQRCIGVSLKELPRVAHDRAPRFDVLNLVNVVLVGRAGPIATISIRALLQYCKERGFPARALGVAASLPQNSTIPRLDVLDPTTQSDAPRRQSRAQWHDALHAVLTRIETGAKHLARPLSRDALPEGAKQLLPIVKEECARRKVEPPTKPGTLLKKVHQLGWSFGGAGIRDTTGELRRFANAGLKNDASAF